MPRPLLRLFEPELKNLAAHYQSSRFHKDLDMCLLIQGLLLVCQRHRERDFSQLIPVARRTLQYCIHRYRVKVIPSLAKAPFKGAKSPLTDEQKNELSLIIAACPQQACLHTRVCTTPIIVKLVKDLFRVSYHPYHIRKILHSLRFSVQYPGKNLSKSDENAQQRSRL